MPKVTAASFSLSRRLSLPLRLSIPALALVAAPLAVAESTPTAAASYHKKVAPILEKYCYDCHGNGLEKGKVSFDTFASDKDMLAKRDLWLAALKNVRAGMMPPREEGAEDFRPNAEELATLTNWIKFEAFGTDVKNPDPGRVTVRRLNRIEYRNTISDLMGIDFNSEVEFPPDDTGGGFDNNGDVLTISPLLMEKYLAAAEKIVETAVPKVYRELRERTVSGREIRGSDGANGDRLSVRKPAKISRSFSAEVADKYRVTVEFEVRGSFDFDAGKARFVGKIDGEEKFTENIAWSERRTVRHEYELDWKAGNHTVNFEMEPEPVETESSGTGGTGGQASTFVTVRVASVQVVGPLSPEHWQVAKNHPRFFPDGAAPADPAKRDAYAQKVLRTFASKAFRRPVDEPHLKQLVEVARKVYSLPGKTFEEGIQRAMMAVLSSPRFLFRVEEPEAKYASQPIAPVDEYSLASRLSYFLWSTMPDAELISLAEKGELRKNLKPQVTRMLKDAKAQSFVKHFTGQWLQARDVESVPINARVVLGPNAPRNRDGRIEFDGQFRRWMRSETEMYFDYVIKEDRSLLELIDSDYTFVNERLAQHYGLPEVKGENLRYTKLPEDSVRGGVLTQGTVLAVTSNPTRTSPVKRGLFILENILGTPPPPAPPNVPDLEESKDRFKGREPKLAEMLAVHRENKLCSSCHERMDPLGLAMENFNALGSWREKDAGQKIEAGGKLVTGEPFADVRELKKIIVKNHASDVYHCLTEKLMTYALGRGVEYYDTQAIDEIVAALEKDGGRMSTLLMGVIESAPFQKQRTQSTKASAVSLVAPAR